MNEIKTTPQINEQLQLKRDCSKNILVYDSSRGFSRFIKRKLKGQFNATIINSKPKLKKHQMDKNCIIFYIVNDAMDILLFSKVYFKSKLVFLGITVKNLEDSLINYDGVIPMNLELPKKELMDYIQHHLQTKKTDKLTKLPKLNPS